MNNPPISLIGLAIIKIQITSRKSGGFLGQRLYGAKFASLNAA
jgi:hypothetical protein